MADSFDKADKTEEASQKRIVEAHATGNFARSGDLNTAFVLLGVAAVLLGQGGNLVAAFRAEIIGATRALAHPPSTIDASIVLMRTTLVHVGQMAMPFLLVSAVLTIGFHFLQAGGFLIVRDALGFKLEKLDPIKNLARILSLRSVVKIAAALLKFAVIVGVLGWGMRSKFEELTLLADMPLERSLPIVGALVLILFLRATGALVVLGGADWMFQRWQHSRDLRMTMVERKQEMKEDSGSEEVRRKVRMRQREIAEKPLAHIVPKATVIVTNPSHVAVALEFEEGKSAVPVVVAKGIDRVAEEIKRLARQHSVPCIEQPPLARALFRDVKVGQPIPEPLYRAVASVLAIVWRLREERRRRSRSATAAGAGRARKGR